MEKETKVLVTGTGTNDGLSIVPSIYDSSLVFACKICAGKQALTASYYKANEIFPVCNECLKDLKEFVQSKRKGANS